MYTGCWQPSPTGPQVCNELDWNYGKLPGLETSRPSGMLSGQGCGEKGESKGQGSGRAEGFVGGELIPLPPSLTNAQRVLSASCSLRAADRRGREWSKPHTAMSEQGKLLVSASHVAGSSSVW